MPLDLQVKLLQVLQDRTLTHVGGTRAISMDVRVIAATNRDLSDMVEQKLFRSDLYYRLNVIPITVPPLKARRDDVIPLLYLYLQQFNTQYTSEKKFSERVLHLLLEYDWPGNVRELRNIVERLLVTSPAELITVDDLPDHIRRGAEVSRFSQDEGLDYKTRIRQFESSLAREALKSTAARGRPQAISKSANPALSEG